MWFMERILIQRKSGKTSVIQFTSSGLKCHGGILLEWGREGLEWGAAPPHIAEGSVKLSGAL